jgi:alkylation response protein AidB-like acyl-CoA dehydrogenase
VSAGVTLFAVPGDAPGITSGAPYAKLGQRSSLQADVSFDSVRVPLDHAMSEVGQGLAASHRALVAANLVNAAKAVGIARAAYDEALRWSVERVQGGAPIFRHQLVARDLGAMRVDLDAACGYTWHTARAFARGEPGLAPELVSAANVFATEAVVRVARGAVELFGGRGMMEAWPVAKLLRDALTLQHANGTNSLLLLKLGARDAERAAAL